jgi:nucleoside triphosphate diphosphatase
MQDDEAVALSEERVTPRHQDTLITAFRIQQRAAGVGFDWPNARGPLEKVKEETRELETELTPKGTAPRSQLPAVEAEIGDLLFAVVNLARKLGIDPRAALQQANDKFQRRFAAVKRLAEQRGLELGGASLEQLDRLWEHVKGTE